MNYSPKIIQFIPKELRERLHTVQSKVMKFRRDPDATEQEGKAISQELEELLNDMHRYFDGENIHKRYV